MHGHGKLIHANHDVYEGNFVYGSLNNPGITVTSNLN
jgi:hypothetical protein